MKTSNHLLRRLTAALLAAVLALSIALPVFASDDGDTIYINSVSDLLSLAKNCAYDQWSVGKTVILQKDLSLEGMLWEPIPSFSGQFKGNGHTISDLTITGQYSPAGLFGIVEEQGSIESLSVRGIVSVSDSADTTTGGIVGRVVALKDDTFVLETGSDRVRIRFRKSAIAAVEKLELNAK